ncbi:catecholate siderophore receptor Fiu [Acinetobacter sp.]|uniref:catecholate siderophore receptor Fiu n=1 Tax=Acinetobacter sp. TaxID=472 RepID=UPI0035AFD5D9
MAQIKSRKHSKTASIVALAAALPLAAQAAGTEQQATQLPTITVKSEAENKYKADKVSSAKYTQPLADTPQTISVIKKELLKEQGATSLTEALRNTPGITLQLGENGNTSAGDSFQMRGFDTKNSIYLDGIRDIGAISRDIFNLEQVEVVKGPSGAEAGRGGAGGYINLVSKLPHLESSQEVSATYNTAEHARLTADINQALSAGTAVRLNVMGQEGGVDGRDYVENNSYAVAPSIAFGLDSDTRFYLYSQHVRQRNIPDGGIPTIGMKGFYYNNTDAKLTQAQRDIINAAVNAAEPVNRENFYGNINDHEDVDAHLFTAKVESDLSRNVKLTNISRFGKTEMERALTGVNALVISNLAAPKDPDSWSVVRTRQGVEQENRILANQTTLNINAKTGFVEHDIVAGLELLREEQFSKTLHIQTPGQAAPAVPPANLYAPDPYQALPGLAHTGAYANGKTDTAAAYLFDTLKFGERFQLNSGVRIDYYDTEADALAIATDSATLAVTKTPSNLGTTGTLVSWKLGSVFKPTSASSIYASYAKSFTPPGAAFALSTAANSASNAANDPSAKAQETQHYEIGTKWTFNEDKLILTAAAYHTENENQITQDPITLQYLPEGKTTVKGLELGAVGQITRAWNVSAGLAFMDTEQENQRTYSTNSKTWTESTSARWSPDWSATLWSTYSVAGFRAGLGARYMDEQKRFVSPGSSAEANMPAIPSYLVFDALLGYTLNDQASLNLNIYNLADKEYISTLNNSGARLVMGQPRSAALTFNYKF